MSEGERIIGTQNAVEVLQKEGLESTNQHNPIDKSALPEASILHNEQVKLSQAVVDPKTGIYTDEYGEQWAGKKRMGYTKYKMAKEKKDSIRFMQGRSGTNQAQLFNLNDFYNVYPIYSLPQSDAIAGVYTDQNGEQWGIYKHFGKRDSDYLEKNKDRVRTIEGRSHKGMKGVLYNLEDASAVLLERDNLPKIDSIDQQHNNEMGQWVPLSFFDEGDWSYLRSHKNDIGTIKARRTEGELALYHLENAQRILKKRDAKPQVSVDSIYRDKSGEWVGATSLGSADYEFIKRHKHKVRTITGRNASGGTAILFNLEDVRSVIAEDRDTVPQINAETGVYSNQEGDWGGATTIGWAEYQYIQKHKSEIKTMRGRNTSGAPITLYNLIDVKKVLSERPVRATKTNGYWKDINVIENEAKSVLAAGIDISSNSLKNAKLHGLLNAIYAYYPGKMSTLREKLGLDKANVESAVSPDEADEMMRSLEIQ